MGFYGSTSYGSSKLSVIKVGFYFTDMIFVLVQVDLVLVCCHTLQSCHYSDITAGGFVCSSMGTMEPRDQGFYFCSLCVEQKYQNLVYSDCMYNANYMQNGVWSL